MAKTKKIQVKGITIATIRQKRADFISLTDIAKYKSASESDDVIKNWLRNRSTIEFLGLWEKLNNPEFKPVEFDGFRNQAGSNAFVLSVSKWTGSTKAVGLMVRRGRYGGTYAHKDIAFEFASWISAEFKLFLIKEFQRLKEEEIKRRKLGWDLKRNLAAINYRIHTDAVQKHLIPPKISKSQSQKIYANEADVLNKALFGMTAKEWRDTNPQKPGNLRDYATAVQLVCLSNLESLNAELIRQGLVQPERLLRLNQIAIIQMRSLLKVSELKKLK